VQKLADLASDDLRLCLDNLLEVLLAGRRAIGNVAVQDEALFNAYLSTFWLRPETALLQYCECRIVAPLLKMASEPFLDIGCGNGVHTSLLRGWRFTDDFDVFLDTDLSAADIYNAMPRSAQPVGIAQRGQSIDYGIDIKPAMVEQARRLGTFQSVTTADALNLPFADGQIGCIYSNVLRDFEQTLDPALCECARILRPGGHLILISPTETYQEKLFYLPRVKALREQGQIDRAERYERLDRGRSIFCRQQAPIGLWQDRLRRCGFELIRSNPFASRSLLEFWDTGLRPFSTQLIASANALRGTGGFLPAKRGIVSAMRSLLAPFVADVQDEADGAFRVLVARKADR
jgi:SAM-dependent methyltransferase